MKALSERQAARCEDAKTPRCRCRCGGVLHGCGRGVDFRALPPEDPHASAARPPAASTSTGTRMGRLE